MASFFSPKSICVIGASSNKEKVGFAILNNIIKGGFKGKIYPVNLNEKKILGIKAYANVNLIKNKIDLAVIVIPAQNVLHVLEECGQKGIGNVVIISAGFGESGRKGKILENNLLKIAQKYNIKILGPNALGFINNTIKLNASFADVLPLTGPIAFISQSGALCSAALDLAKSGNMGFSHFVSLGNELNFKELEVIKIVAHDPRVRIIAGYLEDISDGSAFQKIIPGIINKIPIILLKGGITVSGAKAISSHTGSLAGSYNGIKALFKQTGIITVRNGEDLLKISQCLGYLKFSSHFNIAVVTNAGGLGVLAADYCFQNKLNLAKISSKTRILLKKYLPSNASLDNPIDIVGDASSSRYKLALDILARDRNIDVLVVLLTPQAMTEVDGTAKTIIQAYRKYKKPILTSFMGGERVEKAIALLHKNHIPNFIFLEQLIYSLKKISDYKKQKINIKKPYKFNLGENQVNTINNILFNQKGFLTNDRIYDIFKIYKMPLLKIKLVKDENKGLMAASKIGYPLALKIISKKIVHKTDVGGVVLNIKSANDLKKSFQKIINNLSKYKVRGQILGFELSKMAPKGQNIIMGIKKDKLGHMIMFGWGGIYTELINDVSFRLAPLSKKDAYEMIQETKIYKILDGFRSQQKYDIAIVINCLLKLSDLVIRFPQIKELDINPLKLYKHGGKIIDIKMKVE